MGYKYQKILSDDSFAEISLMIKEKEFDRIYCRHSLGHCLSVARIAYIIDLEENLGIDRDMIYGAALLHDIGRYSFLEESGMTHHEAGSIIAEPILRRAGYTAGETEVILRAIKSHKSPSSGEPLSELLYRADKLSRNCFMCDARDTCYWDEDKKNKTCNY